MPYSIPSATSVTTPTGRPSHRRSYTNEHGPGAFASLGALPKRTPPHFHLSSDNSSSNSSESDQETRAPPPIKFRLHLNTAPVPFPRRSPLPSPHLQPAVRPIPNRTSSSPILLSNGKPLKSSLKGSSSSPNIVALPSHSLHLRALSAPSTPALDLPSPTGSDTSVSTPKNVHFPDQVETIRLFNRKARPASLLSHEETETESEAFPFPITPAPLSYTIHTDSLPCAKPARHVILDSIHMDQLILTGSLLVRNISYEKQVYVRFTLDDWQTTSEVMGHFSESLPALPPSIAQPITIGDIAAGVVSQPWDRFEYSIRLEDYAHSLASRTMFLVARYAAAGGEWWDNNSDRNYRVNFVIGQSTPAVSTVPFPTVIPTPATHVRSSSAETLEKRLRGFSLANYARPAPSPLSKKVSERMLWMSPESPVTPALSHSSSDDDDDIDEAPSPHVDRSLPPQKSPPVAPMLRAPPPPRAKLHSPSPSPPSSSDDLYKAFVQKWCFVGGVGA